MCFLQIEVCPELASGGRSRSEQYEALLGGLFVRRPRVLNLLHWANLVNATQPDHPRRPGRTGALRCRCLSGARNWHPSRRFRCENRRGISTGRPSILCCWPVTEKRGANPCWSICQRHLRNSGVKNCIRILRGYSRAMASQVPDQLDFAFADGDHSWEGIRTDWMNRF
jgi:hypothetical protein